MMSQKFKNQKTQNIGVALTDKGRDALRKIGAIKNSNQTKEEGLTKTINEASDIILVHWANYVIKQIEKDNYSKKLNSQDKEIFMNHFLHMMINYYNYLDQIESGLPKNLIQNSIMNYHEQFRKEAYLLNETLKTEAFIDLSYNKTPYLNAMIFDNKGINLVDKGMLGEQVDSDGKIVTFNLFKSNYTVYLQETENDKAVNYGKKAILIKNKPYIKEEYLCA